MADWMLDFVSNGLEGRYIQAIWLVIYANHHNADLNRFYNSIFIGNLRVCPSPMSYIGPFLFRVHSQYVLPVNFGLISRSDLGYLKPINENNHENLLPPGSVLNSSRLYKQFENFKNELKKMEPTILIIVRLRSGQPPASPDCEGHPEPLRGLLGNDQ